jgi:ankyrin repeat protein
MVDIDINSPTAFEDIRAYDSIFDNNNKLLLVQAAFYGKYDIVKLLISKGFDLSVFCESIGSLLSYAIQKRWFDVIDVYLNNPEALKCVINVGGYLGEYPILELLFMHEDDDTLDIRYLSSMMQYADLSITYSGNTLLHLGLNHINPKVQQLFRDYEDLSLIKGAD